MKTKRMNVGLIAVVALALTQAGNASVIRCDVPIIGFYAFEGNKPVDVGDDTADYEPCAGVSGWVTSPLQDTKGGGGSFDGNYGDGPSTSPNQSLPQNAPSDGAATVRRLSAGSLNIYSVLSFWITNSSTMEIPLCALFFDAAEIPPIGTQDQVLLTKIWEDATFVNTASDTWWGLGTELAPAIPVLGETTANDYPGYMISLKGKTLGVGETIAIMFSGSLNVPGTYDSDTIWVDNVAITAIPEPGSVLGLGFVLASGLMLRNRRKS